MTDEKDAGPKHHDHLRHHYDRKRYQRQNNQWDCGLREQCGTIGYRQRFPEQDAAIAALAV
jgi:hypothetical protein